MVCNCICRTVSVSVSAMSTSANQIECRENLSRNLSKGECQSAYLVLCIPRHLGSRVKDFNLMCDRCDVFNNVSAREFGWPNSLLLQV